MEEILEKLSQTSGVLGAFIAGMDGLVVAGRMGPNRDQDILAATAADLYREAKTAFEKMDDGKIHLLTIERSLDKVFIHHIENEDTLLVLVTEPKINLGLVRMEIQQASQKLQIRS